MAIVAALGSHPALWLLLFPVSWAAERLGQGMTRGVGAPKRDSLNQSWRMM